MGGLVRQSVLVRRRFIGMPGRLMRLGPALGVVQSDICCGFLINFPRARRDSFAVLCRYGDCKENLMSNAMPWG